MDQWDNNINKKYQGIALKIMYINILLKTHQWIESGKHRGDEFNILNTFN